MKDRDKEISQPFPFWEQLKLPAEDHKQIKGLDPKFKNQNLIDNMTDLELIFNMLGEAATTEITRAIDAQGFVENKEAARKGGSISGEARQKLEQETWKSVVNSDNYIKIAGKVKELEKDKNLKKLKRYDKSELI